MMKAWSDGGFWSSHTFRHDWRGSVVSPVWNRHGDSVLDSQGSRQLTWNLKLENGKWPLKRCTFRGALWLSQSLKHYWEQNLLLLLAKEEGWRFTLRGSWIVGHLPPVSGYRQHSDLWIGRMEPDVWALSPCFYSTNIPPCEIVSPLDTGFPIFPRCCSTFPNFFHVVRFRWEESHQRIVCQSIIITYYLRFCSRNYLI